MRVSRGLRAGAAGMGLVIGLAACSGGGGPSVPSLQPTPSGSVTSGSATPETSAAALNLDAAVRGLSDLRSYAMEVVVADGGESHTLSLLATSDPVRSTHYTLTGPPSLELITIEGQGSWAKPQGSTWTTARGDAYISLLDPWAPDRLIRSFQLARWTGARAVVTVNDMHDVPSYYLHVDGGTARSAGVMGFPPNTSMDVWVAVDGGYLLGLAYRGADPSTGQDAHIDVQVRRVNDPSITIEPPATS